MSIVHKDTELASVGMWISSEYWNKGWGTQVLNIFMQMVKEYYEYKFYYKLFL